MPRVSGARAAAVAVGRWMRLCRLPWPRTAGVRILILARQHCPSTTTSRPATVLPEQEFDNTQGNKAVKMVQKQRSRHGQ